MGGSFTTTRQALVDFSFPELSGSKKVTWICHVDDKTDKSKTLYDMIIGMDLMTTIGIMVDTKEKVIKWEGHMTPLKAHGDLQDQEHCNMLHDLYAASVLDEAEERQSKILEAD